MVRTTRRGLSAIRIWSAPDAPVGIGQVPAGTLTAEWRDGRLGHPSTYGLLGARIGGFDHEPALLGVGKQFSDSLAGVADLVTFRLDPHERNAIAEADRSVIPIVAAQAYVSSAPFVFYALARFLSAMSPAVTETDEEIWAAWDVATTAARVWADARRFERG